MKKSLFCATLLGLVATLAAGSVVADSTFDFGKREFDSKCASCHGLSGKGDGPMRPWLTVKAADLTTISQKNGGVLPVVRLNEVIDGRMELKAHGTREMPVWGLDYLALAGKDWPVHMDVPFNPEFFVRSRIMALVDYIARLQEK